MDLSRTTSAAAPGSAAPAAAAAFSPVNKAGLALTALLGVGDVVDMFVHTPAGEVGPPDSALQFGGVVGLVTLVGVAVAVLTRSRGAVRIVAAVRVLTAVTAMPAFFFDAEPVFKLLAGTIVLLTVAAVTMMLVPPRGAAPVVD